MPDFNKGDFTQQGVAGHVNANLRLNEKRLVNIDLTSNEEAEGCTIVGAVTDLLNNKVYGIGAGVSGNIEITENGENINVAPYATATVNVSGGGGSDVPMCKLTVLANGAGSVTAGTAENSVVIFDNLVEGSGVSISGDSVEVYSPYSYQNNTYIVTYFSRMGYPDEETALASVTNLNNISVIAYQNESLFWNIILAVTDPTLPSSATIPCEPK